MRAAVYHRVGPAREVLELRDLPEPEPGCGEVRVRLAFSAVNPTDWRARAGFLGNVLPFPMQIPGQDGAGVIDAVGPNVEDARLGEAVWVYHAAWQRPTGTAAQSVVVPSEQAVAVPRGIGLKQAAALGIPFMTAHRCLFADGPINDRRVLVAGGAGAVGHAAIQLAKRGGAEVIATVSTPEKAALAEQAGADLVVNYRQLGATDRIRRAAPTGVERILELALATNLELDLAVISHGGTIMTYAPERADPQLPVARLMRAGIRLSFMLIYTTPQDALRAAVEAITSALIDRALHPLPTTVFALEEIAAAHEASERGITGKVVLDTR
ncbi:MAG TPA: NADPH:quinone reductase [Pseudonocardiaceae bacterium]|jgi:NADPH2:quinone reductase|nr:NADPH:quinone reductase [Pseudonocardiaceae bacterium]